MLNAADYSRKTGMSYQSVLRRIRSGKIKTIKRGKHRYIVEPKQKETVTPQQPKVTPHPTAGPKVTAFEDHLDAQLASDTESVKGGPGRSPKEPPPEPQRFELDVIRPIVAMPFDFWSKSQDLPQLKLTDKEADLLSKPVKDLIDYYLPQIPVVAWAWISLSIATYSVMKIRLDLIAELKKQKSAAGQGQAETKGQGGPTPPVKVTMPTPQEIKTVVV